MNISFTPAPTHKKHPEDSQLGFGNFFTDYMFNLDYNKKDGWHNPRIEPYAPLTLDPSTMVLHYGQSIFEGLKAYRTGRDSIQLFRPLDNFKRLNRSAERLCMPTLDENFLVKALKELLRIERQWVPSEPGTSLYIRPAIIATDPYLGLRSSHTYRFFIILSPVGAYYPEGFNPVKIWVTPDYVRTVRGGLGEAKTAGNYAASLYATNLANADGYTQVLWLDGVELKYIEEVGSMNIFFLIDNEIITPKLTGSILAGITRDSVIQLARHWGYRVTERRILIEDIYKAHNSGTLQEVFGSGTAAIISPVEKIKYNDQEITIGDGNNTFATKLFNQLMDIQYGNIDDPFGWTTDIDKTDG